ncbi:MAG TPA: S1C family serine protease [Candidatus Thermoplasmatota archaeon]
MDSPVSIPRAVVPSVVFLRSEIPEAHPTTPVLGNERMGAGVAVGPRQVLTAHYLVIGASQAVVVAGDGRIREARQVSLDHESGLALLTVDGPDLRPAPLGRSAQMRPGKPVFLLTCTGEQERKGASGLVASVGPFEAFWEYMLDEAIMTTVLNPGLAGAPLFDYDARVVGIVSLGLAAVGRYSLAIPVDLFLAHRSILEGNTERTQPRAWLGVYPQGNDGAVAITGVVPGGPADRAGLAQGDLVLSVDGQSVTSLRELYRAFWRKGPGEPLDLQVLRESQIRVVHVVAGDRYDFYK